MVNEQSPMAQVHTTLNIPLSLWQAFVERCQAEMRDPIVVFNEQVAAFVHEKLEMIVAVGREA